MKIAIINAHVAYLYMLAKTGHEFFVFNHPGRPCWDFRQRPLPPNVHLMDNVQVILQLLKVDEKFFNAVILQDNVFQHKDGSFDVADRFVFETIAAKKIMLFHNSWNVDTHGMPPDAAAACKSQLKERLKDCKKVFISKFKKESWEMAGDVILPGFDLEEWGGYTGIEPRVITCLNNATARDFMNGTKSTQLACLDYAHVMLGEEGGQGNLANDFEHFKQILRASRYYMALNNPEFEDGYNLSQLEFMACGGCPITLDHPTSPVKAGVNGFKSNDLQEINKFLWNTTHEQAYNMGREAQKTIKEQFPIERFVENWNKVLDMP